MGMLVSRLSWCVCRFFTNTKVREQQDMRTEQGFSGEGFLSTLLSDFMILVTPASETSTEYRGTVPQQLYNRNPALSTKPGSLR